VRVLLVADAVGGVFTYAVELARALAKRGVEVAVATTGRALSSDQRADLRGLDVYESAWKLEWMDDPWDDVARTGEWLLALAGRLRPDVVHLDDFAHGALPLGAPKVVVAHSCVLSWFEAVRGHPAPPAYDRYREVVREGLTGADLTVAPTRAMRAALERLHGRLAPGLVIPNGRDPRRFPPGEKEPFVLCAARLWDEAKNAAALERIAPDLPWPVFVAGEAAHPVTGSAAAPIACRPLGRLAPGSLAGWYARASIYALPARYEPFGLSALEAALAGCALVLGDIPSLRETWDGAAVFAAPDDHAALREAIERLAHDADLRARLAGEARRRALRLGPDRMAERYLAAYGALLAPQEDRPCAW
jgi:glycosyltransferase involved in cell wall biosynthesis